MPRDKDVEAIPSIVSTLDLSSTMGVKMEETSSAMSIPRPSLFLACRLASIVQQFRHRLQERVQQRKKNVNPFGPSYHRGLRLRALSDLERYIHIAPLRRLKCL
jgi:hypothetical protein